MVNAKKPGAEMREERQSIQKRIQDLKAELPDLVRRMHAARPNSEDRDRYDTVSSQLDLLLEKLWDRPASDDRVSTAVGELGDGGRSRGTSEREHSDGRDACRRNLVTVGTASQVPAGQVAWFFLDGVRLAVANVGGRLYAFRDACTQCGCSLANGELKGPTVICPRDLRAFDVRTGEALGGVPLSPVTTYAVHVDGDEVRVCMHPTRTP